jgi:hypothetical protein
MSEIEIGLNLSHALEMIAVVAGISCFLWLVIRG